jgi:hypothetical protein
MGRLDAYFKPRESDIEDDSNELDEPDSDDQNDTKLGIHITRASLKGEGVLESAEMNSLVEKGFYISKIIWQAKDSNIDSDIYEFEAQFSEPDTCTKFSYMSRGYYAYKGHQEHSQSKTQFTTAEDRQFSKLIEAAALTSLSKLVETLGE